MKQTRLADVFGADLRSLAALRIVLALVVLMDLAGRATSLRALYTDEGAYPRQLLIGNLNQWQWSVFLATGTVAIVQLLFVGTAIAAILLLLGYRTRLMTLIVWVMLVSIQLRNPLLLNAGDTLLRLLLFWGILLPLGARWSIDAKRSSVPSRKSTQYLSIATAGILLQIAFMYWFTAALKTGRPWREDGTALYYALGLSELSRPVGQFLHRFPNLLEFLTFMTLGIEVIAPILLFMPFFTGPVRTAAVFSIISLQIGIYLTLSIGFFPWLSAFCMVCFLPGWFWDNALPKIFSRMPGRSPGSPTAVRDGDKLREESPQTSPLLSIDPRRSGRRWSCRSVVRQRGGSRRSEHRHRGCRGRSCQSLSRKQRATQGLSRFAGHCSKMRLRPSAWCSSSVGT